MKFKVGDSILLKDHTPAVRYEDGLMMGDFPIAGTIIDLSPNSIGKIIGYIGIYVVDFDGTEVELEESEMRHFTPLEKLL